MSRAQNSAWNYIRAHHLVGLPFSSAVKSRTRQAGGATALQTLGDDVAAVERMGHLSPNRTCSLHSAMFGGSDERTVQLERL